MSVAPPSPPYIPARHKGDEQRRIRALVVHGTVSHDDPGTARQIAKWWHGPTSPVSSAHYITDPAETIQCVYDHTVAYHCGYNPGTLGHEYCDEQTGPANRWLDDDSQRTLRRGAKIDARLCAAYGIEPRRPSVAELRAKGPHGIYSHDDSRRAFGHTTHRDPRDFPWKQYLALLHEEYDLLTGQQPAKPPRPPKQPRKVRTAVKIDQVSSRYSRSPGSLAADVERSAAWADIILLTEVTDEKRRAVLDLEGWTRSQDTTHGHGRAEVAILTRDAKWRVEKFHTYQIGPDLGPGGPIVAGFVLLRHVTTRATFLVSITHLPASVEGTWDSARAKAYRDAVNELRLIHLKLRRLYKPDGSAAFGDWNLNLHRKWVREWIGKAWPGLTLPRAEVIPAGGTHAGGRLIDWFVRRSLYITFWRILPATDGSDHRAIRVAGHLNTERA